MVYDHSRAETDEKAILPQNLEAMLRNLLIRVSLD